MHTKTINSDKQRSAEIRLYWFVYIIIIIIIIIVIIITTIIIAIIILMFYTFQTWLHTDWDTDTTLHLHL